MTQAVERQTLYLSGLSEVRAIDEKARTATFVAATENGVDTWRGPEVLRMSGARLARFRKNPVFVDSHNSHDAAAVIGSVKISVDRESRQLLATVTYASTVRAENIWTLVREGHLRAVSVGFIPNREKTKRLEEGQEDGQGEGRVVGPAVLIREWELVELSQVAVPADEDALRRAFHNEEPKEEPKERAMKYPETEKGAPAPDAIQQEGAKITSITKLQSEKAAREAVALKEHLLAVTPRSLHEFAEEQVILNPTADLATLRALVLAELQLKRKPVGTPSQPETPETPGPVKRDLGVDEVVNVFTSLRS